MAIVYFHEDKRLNSIEMSRLRSEMQKMGLGNGKSNGYFRLNDDGRVMYIDERALDSLERIIRARNESSR